MYAYAGMYKHLGEASATSWALLCSLDTASCRSGCSIHTDNRHHGCNRVPPQYSLLELLKHVPICCVWNHSFSYSSLTLNKAGHLSTTSLPYEVSLTCLDFVICPLFKMLLCLFLVYLQWIVPETGSFLIISVTNIFSQWMVCWFDFI